MKDHPDYRAVLMTLQEVMKAKGYTYARLAREIGVSEVTVKRIFSSGQSCSFERLVGICEQIGVSFLEVAALARKEEEVDHILTPEQETYFAGKPTHFAIFKELYADVPQDEVMRSWKLNDAAFFRILRALEKLGLIDVLPGNKIRKRVHGNIRMTHRGPLAKKILRPQIISFLDHVDRHLENDDVCMHSAEIELAQAHLAEFVEEVHALGAKYRARAYRDKSLLPAKKLQWVRWLFCLAPYRTDWHQYEKG